MLTRTNATITRTMYLKSSLIICICRIFGLAPFTIQKIGNHYVMHWSTKYAVYNYILAFFLVSLCVLGITRDMLLGENDAIRMKQSTFIVIIFEVIVFASTVLIGMIGSRYRLSNFWALIDALLEIDSNIHPKNLSKTRKVSLSVLALVQLAAISIFTADICVWIFTSAIINNRAFFYLQCYMPLYMIYFIVILMHCQFWHNVNCIKWRIKHLNDSLKVDIENMSRKITNEKFVCLTRNQKLNLGKNLIGNLIADDQKSNMDEYVSKLIRVHEKICESVTLTTELHGLPALIMLLSCLFHMIETPYFLLMEVRGNMHPIVLIVQVAWIVFHIIRLLIIVEPCHYCIKQATMTAPLVCKLITCDMNPKTKEQLKLFATQLFHRQIEFSLCGLCTVGRHLLIGIAGAVTTYLVILYQFQVNIK